MRTTVTFRKKMRKVTAQRIPEYSEHGFKYRIISTHGDKWLAQVRTAEHGNRESDCWYSLAKPGTKQEAQNLRDVWAIGNRKVFNGADMGTREIMRLLNG